MKILDIKLTDKSLQKRFYKPLDKRLKNSSSFEEQRYILLTEYNIKTLRREDLIGRKSQLERRLEYNYSKLVEWASTIIIPCIVAALCTLTDASATEIIIGSALAILCLRSVAREAVRKWLPNDISWFEIRHYELNMINNLLASDEAEINVFDFAKKLPNTPYVKKE